MAPSQLSRRPQPFARVLAWFDLIRWKATLVAACYSVATAYVAHGIPAARSLETFLRAAVIGLLVGYGFALNDCADAKSDAVGKAYRPIPAGRITLRASAILTVSLASAALCTAAYLGRIAIAYTVGALALSTLYSYSLKRLFCAGHAIVGILVGSTFLFSAVPFGVVPPKVWAVSLLSALFIFAHEILYAVQDEYSDRAAGISTTATVLGLGGALWLFKIIAALFIVATAVFLATWHISSRSVPFWIACTLFPTAYEILTLWKQPSRLVILRNVRLSRYIWLCTILPFILSR